MLYIVHVRKNSQVTRKLNSLFTGHEKGIPGSLVIRNSCLWYITMDAHTLDNLKPLTMTIINKTLYKNNRP